MIAAGDASAAFAFLNDILAVQTLYVNMDAAALMACRRRAVESKSECDRR